MKLSQSLVAIAALFAGVSAKDDAFDYVSTSRTACVHRESVLVSLTVPYIIVGGGTAGTALATRLSLGLPKSEILLIESGPAGADDLRINVPGLRGSMLGSSLDWNFATVPQASLDAARQGGGVVDAELRVYGMTNLASLTTSSPSSLRPHPDCSDRHCRGRRGQDYLQCVKGIRGNTWLRVSVHAYGS
jgi:choline dehydrogenase-like flavoprotein